MLDRGVTNIKRFAPDILADQAINLSKPCYYSCVLMGLALPAAIGGLVAGSLPGALSGFYWGGVLRLVVVQHGVYFINSGCHSVGHRRFLLRDNSRNLGVLALPTLGGSLHNNHHAFPSSATTALAPGDVDPGFMIIDALRRLGLVFDIVVPSHAAVAAKSMGRLGRSARTRRQQDDA
jgi:stearoyl-CoA desaturase (delta-9 desaturase)